MFKKLIKKLYFKYCEPDLVAMTRAQLMGVFPVKELLDIPRKERKAVITEAQTILNSATFKLAVNNVKARNLADIQNRAQSMTEIYFDRFRIDGVESLVEELAGYMEEDNYVDDNFDKFNIL